MVTPNVEDDHQPGTGDELLPQGQLRRLDCPTESGTTNGNGWETFAQVFAGIYPLLAAKGKPILIGEMASTELGGNKALWISGIVPTLKSNFPMIRGFAWFDINKETDWRIASSTASQDAFVAMGKDPYMNP